MRHRNTVKKLDRTTGPRKALMRGLITNLISKESITTTVAKAKAVRPMVEKIITKGKKNTEANKRAIAQVVYTKAAQNKVTDVLAPRFKSRNGGYVRITKLGFRKGDGAAMAKIEFLD